MSYFTYTQQNVATAIKEARARYLEDLALEAYEVAVSEGWEDDSDKRTFGDECALITSEVSEAFEAFRKRGFQSWEGPDGKPEGVGSEFADILIRLLHYCHTRGIDLQAEYDRKTAYNRTREYRHGSKRL
jgi:NTP pyrophosphatase (non-canonical NTP hydrolase)